MTTLAVIKSACQHLQSSQINTFYLTCLIHIKHFKYVNELLIGVQYVWVLLKAKQIKVPARFDVMVQTHHP